MQWEDLRIYLRLETLEKVKEGDGSVLQKKRSKFFLSVFARLFAVYYSVTNLYALLCQKCCLPYIRVAPLICLSADRRMGSRVDGFWLGLHFK